MSHPVTPTHTLHPSSLWDLTFLKKETSVHPQMGGIDNKSHYNNATDWNLLFNLFGIKYMLCNNSLEKCCVGLVLFDSLLSIHIRVLNNIHEIKEC